MSQSGNRERLSGDVEFQEATPASPLQLKEGGPRAKFAYYVNKISSTVRASFDGNAFDDNPDGN